MLNHTYTSVKNANVVDCGKKEKIPSQPFPLLRDNYLGEYRTELDKKKVLANLGIATELSLEWEFIKGDIGRSVALMGELDSRTKYISAIDGFTKTVIDGILYLESVVGGEQEGEEEQNERLTNLETASKDLSDKLIELKTYLEETIEVDIDTLEASLKNITEKVNNITDLIQVSSKAGNALSLLTADDVEEGETPGLYVPDLSKEVSTATENIEKLQEDVKTINNSLDDFVTKEELGGGDFDFVDQDDFDAYVTSTNTKITNINTELTKTVKTGEDGHVDTLYVNTISKDNDDGNIIITDSFEMDSGVPLDIRFVVKNLEELHALNPQVCYAGMGVIVSDQASLYILREPADGIIDEDFIKDVKGINWKCPEDLVIEVLTQEAFDKKVEEGSINPNMFYYIHEEEVEEPKREDYDSDEAYTEALNKWLRVLQQKYMSAVWGQEIEQLVSNKASNEAVKSLEESIQKLQDIIIQIQGGSTNINLKQLNDQVTINTSNLDVLINENGTIPNLQQELSNLQNTVTNDYVTKASITVDDPETEYIFVKKTSFDDYKTKHDEAIAEQVTTKKVNTTSIQFGENNLNCQETDLLFNDEKIALDKQIPIIKCLSDSDYKDEIIEEHVYYYVYDEKDRYVLDSELTQYKNSQTSTNTILSESTNKNTNSIGDLTKLNTETKNTLVFAINEVNNNLTTLNNSVGDLTQLPEGISQVIEAIKDIYSKINTLSQELTQLKDKVNSLETVESI